jgi:hypothetical protein
MTGKPPFAKMNKDMYYKHVVAENKRREKPRKQDALGNMRVSDELWEMVVGCWRDRPHQRLTMKHVLAHLDIDIAPIYQSHKPPYFTLLASKKCKYILFCHPQA